MQRREIEMPYEVESHVFRVLQAMIAEPREHIEGAWTGRNKWAKQLINDSWFDYQHITWNNGRQSEKREASGYSTQTYQFEC
jgi:hypothetical protein